MLNNQSGIGFGCVSLAVGKSLNHSISVLEKAYEHGIYYFDTAPIYSKGYSEKIVGLFARNKRSKIHIASKFGLGEPMNTLLPVSFAMFLNKQKKIISNTAIDVLEFNNELIPYRRIDKIQIECSLYQSLKRLKTDYLDCFLLHEGRSDFLTDEAKFFLESLKKSGVVIKIGLASNFANIKKDQSSDLWDVLQYENSPVNKISDYFILEHPNKEHIYHSSLKNLKLSSSSDIELKDFPGLILAYEQKKNPSGKILFSTKSSQHLEDNLSALERFSTYNEQYIMERIENALS